MAAETSSPPLTKVDSAVGGLSSSPPKEIKHRRASSSAGEGVRNINDLQDEGIELQIAKETQKLNWRINKSPTTVDDPNHLKKMLTEPPVKRIDLHFLMGLEVTARNMKGVTIKDALDAIYKQYKKKADDELENPVLAGFEFDPTESATKLFVHLKAEGAPQPKKKGKKAQEEDL